MDLVVMPPRVRVNFAARSTAAAAVAWVILAVVGCGKSGPPLYPVKGKVTIDGKPATEGGVVFHSVDNPMVQLIGNISSNGDYAIVSKKELGAPAGHYKVTALITETPKRPNGQPMGLPRTISNPKYADASKSPLTVEVKPDAGPNAYDLAVTK
jgi:hypothetical protein